MVAEGDSTLVIKTIKKLHQATHWEKISKSWRIERLVQQIGDLIPDIAYLIPVHVCRSGNVATNFLANWGCNNHGKDLDVFGYRVTQDEGVAALREILKRDMSDNLGPRWDVMRCETPAWIVVMLKKVWSRASGQPT